MKQIRSIRAAWRNTSCTKASKLGKIFDTITEHTHQLLRLYMPSDNSEEMLSAILGLYGREKRQKTSSPYLTQRNKLLVKLL